jgi:hypothetical protein
MKFCNLRTMTPLVDPSGGPTPTQSQNRGGPTSDSLRERNPKRRIQLDW